MVGLAMLLAFAALAPGAQAQRATAALGLSDSATNMPCALYPLDGCPAPNPGNALLRRYQALARARTGGANAFRYARTSIPWDTVSTGGAAVGSGCAPEPQPPAYYGTPWITLAERYELAARKAGMDPLITITNNDGLRYPQAGNPADPSNPSANQYLCGFKGIVSTLDAFAAQNGIAPPTEYEVYNEPDGARVRNSCNPTPRGLLRPSSAEQCAAWYYYEANAANVQLFSRRLTLVALAADGDSANDRNLIAIRAYGRYLTGKLGLYPTVWSFHPYEDISGTGYLDDGELAHGDTSRVTSYITSLYRSQPAKPHVWLTEVSVQLTDPVGEYLGVPEGCDDGEGDDPPPYTLGACLDANPQAQAYAASDFLALPRLGGAFASQIARIYWHGFENTLHHPTTWDSALVSPGDEHERASFCVLTGEAAAQAAADPECNDVLAARDSEDSVWAYPEPIAAVAPTQPAAAAPGQAATTSADPAPPPSPPPVATISCPQPWCAFRMVLGRLPQLG